MKTPRFMLSLTAALLALTLAAASGCDTGSSGTPEELPPEGKADSSWVAVFLNFSFDGELYTTYTYNVKGQIEEQLLYSVGQLNGENSIGRLDQAVLTGIQTTAEGSGSKVTYHADMLVAWGSRTNVPTTYTLRLPRDVSYAGQEAFTEKYSHDCVDWSAHDVDASSMWYYYRPESSGCELDPADVVDMQAEVTESDLMTTGKFPEYDKIWEDDAFRVTAIFGKYEDGATTSSDSGISAYNNFVRSIKGVLAAHSPVTVPENVPDSPGIEIPDVTFTAALPDGKQVEIVALLVDNVRTAGAEFDARYEALSSTADFIAYNGHSGLGANIRALASKGHWVAGQYVVIFMNGCDTYAYVDSSLFDAHAAVNADDAVGTRYVDLVMNAMPSYFSNMPGSTLTILQALMDHANPLPYEQIFARISSTQVVLVSGEQDNVFTPGDPGGEEPVENWTGMDQSGTLARNAELRYETPKLQTGSYLFEMTGTGDADLHVRVGTAPTLEVYDCRPYRADSNETCRIELSAPNVIHVLVSGYAASSDFSLSGKKD